MHHNPMLPPPVERALNEYRELLAGMGLTWGEPPVHYVRMMSFLRFPQVAEKMRRGAQDEHAEFRDVLAGELPDGLAALRITAGGHRLEAGAARAVLSPDP